LQNKSNNCIVKLDRESLSLKEITMSEFTILDLLDLDLKEHNLRKKEELVWNAMG